MEVTCSLSILMDPLTSYPSWLWDLVLLLLCLFLKLSIVTIWKWVTERQPSAYKFRLMKPLSLSPRLLLLVCSMIWAVVATLMLPSSLKMVLMLEEIGSSPTSASIHLLFITTVLELHVSFICLPVLTSTSHLVRENRSYCPEKRHRSWGCGKDGY